MGSVDDKFGIINKPKGREGKYMEGLSAVSSQKSWNSMSPDEKIESLKNSSSQQFSQLASWKDALTSENHFLRSLVAIKMGLDEKQIDQLFNSKGVGLRGL